MRIERDAKDYAAAAVRAVPDEVRFQHAERAFLPGDIAQAFQAGVNHERGRRARLEKAARNGA